jgi:excisionase family DNA binding protein
MSDSNGWITAEELADFLDLPITSVWRLSRDGTIPSYRLGRLMRFDLVEVRAALKTPAPEQVGTSDGEVVEG